MREPELYRYFIGCRPDAQARAELALVGNAAGQKMRPDLYHLTFGVVAELRDRDRTLALRLDRAFAANGLPSVHVALRRLVGGPSGARAVTSGRQVGIQRLYRMIVERLAACGVEPLHRPAGLKPHVTVGYEACPMGQFPICIDWRADELLLIESEVGLMQHNVLRRWPLLPPCQAQFDFGPVIAAADPGRRSAA